VARALWLPTVLRAAGLTVHEESGWKTRGYDGFDPEAVVCHATAGKLTARQDINIIAYTGSTTAPAPISQLFLARTGEIWVIASGTCNHIGDANLPIPGPDERGNDNAIGIEAGNDNRGEPWPSAQYNAYVTAVAAICRHMGWSTARVFGHKEISYTGKTDPTFGMDAFRSRVAAVLANEGDDMLLTDDLPLTEGQMALIPDDPTIQDGKIKLSTAIGGAYIFSRVALREVAVVKANQSALLAALQAHNESGGGASLEQIKAAAQAGAQAALSEVEISWSGPDQPA